MPQSLDAGTPRSAPACLVDAVLALDVALERRLLYPVTHPYVGASREAVERGWAAALGELGAIRLWIAPSKMGWGEGNVLELPGPRVEALGRLLHSMHVTSVTVDVDAKGDDVLALLDLVHALRTDPRPFDSIQRWVKDTNVPTIHIVALDMDDLRYSDHRDKTPSGETWVGLHQYLAGSDADPERVAKELMETWKDQELLGLSAVRAELLHRLERVKPGEERELSERIVRLLAALPDTVRADLLRIRTPSGSSMLARLVRPLPLRDALTALLELGQVKGALPKGTTAILTQILHCLPDGPAVADSITSPDQDDVDVARVSSALEAMFANRAEREYNPEDYQRRLDELARQANLTVDRSSGRAEALEDVASLVAQAAGIAALTLAEAAPSEEGPLLERLDRSLPALLERGRANVLGAAARALRTRGAEESEAGRAFVAHLAKDVEKLLALGVTSTEARDDLRAVLTLVPVETVGREAMRQLVAGRTGQDVDFLRSLLLDGDGRVLAGLLTESAEKSPERITRVRSLLRDARSREVRTLLERLQHHADRRVRATALAVLVERDGVSPHLATLAEAVAGPDPELSRWALQRLAAAPGGANDVLETLEWLLTARGRHLPTEVFSRVSRLLLQRGTEGIHRVAALLAARCRTLRPRTARLARDLVQGLSEHREDPEVQRVLERWQRSPARWLSCLPEWKRGANRE